MVQQRRGVALSARLHACAGAPQHFCMSVLTGGPVRAAALMRAVLQPVDHQWMTERFRIAAGNRYRRLAAACDDQLPFGRRTRPLSAAKIDLVCSCTL